MRTGPRSFVLLAPVVVALSCEEEPRVEHFPIEVRFLQFADTLGVTGADTIWVGAVVGYRGCTLEDGAIERDGNTVRIGGYARCVFSDPEKGVGLASSPATPNFEMHAFTVPALDPGTYVLDAGQLADTVVVSTLRMTPPTRVTMFGRLATQPAACGDEIEYIVADLVDLIRVYETARGSWMPGFQVLRGVLDGPPTCPDTTVVGRIRAYDPR